MTQTSRSDADDLDQSLLVNLHFFKTQLEAKDCWYLAGIIDGWIKELVEIQIKYKKGCH